MSTTTKKTAKPRKARGILPNDRWLRANGFEEMADAMKKNPELFARIEQANPTWVSKSTKAAKPKPKATEAEHTRTVKRLAKCPLLMVQIESAWKQSEKAIAAGATKEEWLAVFYAAVEKALTIWTQDKEYDYAELRADVLRLKFPTVIEFIRDDIRKMLARKTQV